MRPDVGVLNVVINLLVSSGVVAAFAKAAQLRFISYPACQT